MIMLNYNYLMISRISRLLPINKNAYFFAAPPRSVKGPVVKAPLTKQKPNELSLALVAQQLNINVDSLKRQMLNPQNTSINKEELRLLTIINGVELPERVDN